MRKLKNVFKLVKCRDANTCDAKMFTVSTSGLQQNCYRHVQKLIHFEIVKNNKVNSNENHDEGTVTMKDQPEELQLMKSS